MTTKEPERIAVKHSVRVLGMRIGRNFVWSWDGNLTAPEDGNLTRRHVYQLIGEWLGHYPVASWLKIAVAYVQCRTAEEAIKWDDLVPECILKVSSDIALRLLSKKILRGVHDWFRPITP